MSWEMPIFQKTFKAAGDLSTHQYKFVKLTAEDTVDICSGATDRPIGILQNKPDAANKPAEVMIVGISKVSADAALTVDWDIGTSADGQADRKINGTDPTEYITGRVLVATSAADQYAVCTLNCLSLPRALTAN